MTINEFSPDGYGETTGLDTRRIARPAIAPEFLRLISLGGTFLWIAMFCFLVNQRNGYRDKLFDAYTENAALLSRNQAANAEIGRLRKELKTRK